MQYHILAVDDEPEILDWLRSVLVSAGFRFWNARDGLTALKLCKEVKPDALILDIHLGASLVPGTELLYAIKQDPELSYIVVFVFTGLADQKLEALLMDDFGADDYFLKSDTSGQNLTCRLQSWLRRIKKVQRSQEFNLGSLRIDFNQTAAYIDNKALPLTPREYNLLALAAQKSPGPIKWYTIVRRIWGIKAFEQDYKVPNTVEVGVHRLRRKLGVASKYLVACRDKGLALINQP